MIPVFLSCKYNVLKNNNIVHLIIDNICFSERLLRKKNLIFEKSNTNTNTEKMILTTQEKECLVCLTIELMNADYNITDNEMRFYALLQKDFALTQSDFEKGKAMDPYCAIDILKNMPNVKKAAIGLVLRKLVSVDGQPNNATIDALNEITIKADLGRAIKAELDKLRNN